MKLSEWARRTGISYKTAWRWTQDGMMPVPWRRLPTGTIIVDLPEPAKGERVALYARVSTYDQRADLDRQLARLAQYAAERHLHVVESVAEVGPGLGGGRRLSGKRRVLMRLLCDPTVTAIVVEHRDRLARFGSEYIEAALAAAGRRLIVVDPSEKNDDLVQDMIAVLTSFCTRVYGRRSARNRALSIERALAREERVAKEGGRRQATMRLLEASPMVLRAIRTKLGLTQEQLAKRLGVSYVTVNRWEGGVTKPQYAEQKAILALARKAGIASFPDLCKWLPRVPRSPRRKTSGRLPKRVKMRQSAT